MTHLLSLDTTVLLWVAAHRTPAVNLLMWALSGVARAGTVWLVLGIAAAALRRANVAGVWQMGLALLLAFLVADVTLKPLVDRERPFAAVSGLSLIGTPPDTASFPSGHTASSFAAAFSLSRAWPAATVPLWALAVLVSLSRVYLGAHYPSDVVAGALIGLACAILVVGRSCWPREAIRTAKF